MTFSAGVKKELSSLEILSPCCRHAEAYGMLITGRAFSTSAVSLSTENSDVARLYSQLIQSECKVKTDPPEIHGKKIIVACKKAADRRKILDAFGHLPAEPTLRINRANIQNDCCFQAFLRGAFLSCGAVTEPEKNYHLEFVIPYLKLSDDFFFLMDELSLCPKRTVRKGSHVIYFKDSEKIEDMLTTMGATNSSLMLMGVKINKNIRNRVNRRVNFETANIERTVNAGLAQVKAIEKIRRNNMFDKLTPQLKETAEIRLNNPEASLYELLELHGFSVSRSGINHRLAKLMEIADGLE
jgi:DNA-binding protein WhiA